MVALLDGAGRRFNEVAVICADSGDANRVCRWAQSDADGGGVERAEVRKRARVEAWRGRDFN